MNVISPMLAALILAASGAVAEPRLVPVLLTLYTVDSSGKVSKAVDVKVHVNRLEFDPVTRSDGTIGFSIAPGSYKLTTVTGRKCHHEFAVLPNRELDLQLLIPATGDSCTPTSSAAVTAPAAPAAHASAAAPAEQAPK